MDRLYKYYDVKHSKGAKTQVFMHYTQRIKDKYLQFIQFYNCVFTS